MLAAGEVADFLALGVPIEARFVPDDELHRALAEGRVQCVYAFSAMGSADLYWYRAGRAAMLDDLRENGVVVSHGTPDYYPGTDDGYDDRNVLRLWGPFWGTQRDALLARIPEAHHDAMLEECARMLVELERRWPVRPNVADRGELLDWLIAAGGIDRDKLATELDTRYRGRARHLVRGVRARWVTRNLAVAFNAVTDSAHRFDRSKWKHTEERTARMALLRFGVRLARQRS